jgi:hypothetical protein
MDALAGLRANPEQFWQVGVHVHGRLQVPGVFSVGGVGGAPPGPLAGPACGAIATGSGVVGPSANAPAAPSTLEAIRAECAQLVRLLTLLSVGDMFTASPPPAAAGLSPPPFHRGALIVRCILQPFGNRAIAAVLKAPSPTASPQLSNLALAMLALFHWLVCSPIAPPRRRLEVLQLLLSQEVYDPGALQPMAVVTHKEVLATSPLVLRTDGPGASSLGGVPEFSAGRNPNVRHLVQCLHLARTGEDTDRLLELLVASHDHWIAVVTEFYPTGVAQPASPVLRVDLSFALRVLLLPLLPAAGVTQGQAATGALRPVDNARCAGFGAFGRCGPAVVQPNLKHASDCMLGPRKATLGGGGGMMFPPCVAPPPPFLFHLQAHSLWVLPAFVWSSPKGLF